ncbi:MAG: hypothetical protein JO363_16310, partial [Solirubrobacterales bacterium]|nr:hypothetical protein [Solirubrobacterales bacterium]
ARLAHGDEPLEAARTARELASRAVAQGLREIGAGAGPVDILGIASTVGETASLHSTALPANKSVLT